MLRPHCIDHLKSKAIPFLVLAVAIGTPSVALANVGTPLMWATALHMALGNAFIGILEGVLLARVYGVPAGRAIGVMILANYLSAWLGWTWLWGFPGGRDGINLYNAWPVIWVMVAAAYVVTLLVEWPFVAACFRGRENWFRRSCGASFLIQSVSYVLLFGWFYLASVNSLFTDTTVVSIDQMSLSSNVCVYYIADEDGDIYSLKLNTGQFEKVFDLNSHDLSDCLSFENSRLQKGSQEVVALLESADINQPKVIRSEVVVPDEDCPQYEDHAPLRSDRFASPSSHHSVSKLGSALEDPWTFTAGYWAAQGLSGENTKTGEHIWLALETPFVQWAIRHVIALPENKVLFQLGERQICILDSNTRKVAVLRFGRGAVAVLERPLIQQKRVE